MGKFKIAAIVVVAIFLTYAGLIEPYWIRLVERTIEIEQSDFPEIEIVHVSDLHTSRIGMRERKLLDVISRASPDYVLVTGDLLKNKKGVDACFTLIPQIKAKSGVFVVLGNADGKIRDGIISGALPHQGQGWKILLNQNIDCGKFIIVGIDDPVTHHGDVKKAFEGVEEDKPVIVLCHFYSERVLGDLAKRHALLVLTGHTHGGQVVFSKVMTRMGYVNRSKYLSGLYRLDGLYLNVTKGVGTNLFPFRFLCPPEICILHLRGHGS